MRGRKSKYDTHVEPRFKEIAQWAENGATEKEIAKNLHVHFSTFIEYKKQYPELSDLLKKSRKNPVEEIKAAMKKRAVGFQYTEKKIIRQYIEFPDEIKELLIGVGVDTTGFEKPVLVRTEETLKTALPDTGAALVLLQHWDKDENGKPKWSRDPAKMEIQKEELELKKQRIENENW